jgi:hypothetical protein
MLLRGKAEMIQGVMKGPKGSNLANHPLYDVHTRVAHLRHAMLNLQPGVVFQKVKVLRLIVENELHSPCALVLDVLAQADCDGADLCAHLWGQARRWALLYQLLMPPLRAALTLAEVDHTALQAKGNMELFFNLGEW